MMLVTWVGISLAAAGVYAAMNGDSTANIIYINAYHPGYSWSDGIEGGLRERLEDSGRKIELSVEYLDSRRFPNRVHLEVLATAIASCGAWQAARPSLPATWAKASFTFWSISPSANRRRQSG